ncbi:MAG: trypsin-like peptidase domain-containing protein [Candidatus Azobacteroides sp.]|nr:trypsin-like peptidase domain-containing protein [Candidatus Azobacteroides sp.]
MRFIRLFFVLSNLFAATLAFSQISHGGTPYFLQPSILRSASSYFIEMPSFNLDSVLRDDAINEGNMRGSYRFAYKFYTNISINDGIQTVLPDGTTIKQIGIRSPGAYSINLLLNDFEIPPGGKLFIYSADHSYVVGSFDYRNNSSDQILPIQPVAGESIIVEYSEPADVPFAGHFTITEVNHDYRDILRSEPGRDRAGDYDCMPDVFCENAAEESIRSTVLLIINGSTLCSGVLLNNTSDNDKPYVLTGVHCMCDPTQYPKDMDYYNSQAGTIVAFFNYNRPVCDANIKMKGTEEMSLAGASARVILERKDLALLEFKNSPPDYFNAYYAGWKRDLTETGTKHTNLHHPSGAVKKYGMTDGTIRVVSIPAGDLLDADSHWAVPYWTIGSTYSGSSGSPLFDENQLVIGALTAGYSQCTGTSPNGMTDYFSVIGKGWETDTPTNQLKTYLDPKNAGGMNYPGRDPNRLNPVTRLANARYTAGDSLITSELSSPNQGFVFGNSNLKTVEFAEEFNVTNDVEILGTYFLLPAFSDTVVVTVSVYTGTTSPQTKIYSTAFAPKYMNYSSSSGFNLQDKTLNSVPTETFVVFDKPVSATKKFFISYAISGSASAKFCVYNTKFGNASHANTAWLKDATKGWVTAEAYDYRPMKTSLAIQPLARNTNNTSIEAVTIPENTDFYYDRSGRVLTLKEPLDTPGQIAVYSVGGQLLEKIQIQQGQTAFVLSEKPKGTIGIVKITGNYFFRTGKFMY